MLTDIIFFTDRRVYNDVLRVYHKRLVEGSFYWLHLYEQKIILHQDGAFI